MNRGCILMKIKLNGNDFYRVTSRFHEIDSAHPKPHVGIDLAMPEGTKLFSPAEGVVEKIVDFGSTNVGKGIFIRTKEGDQLVLGHLSDNSQVYVGQQVKVGDYLGLTGNTGHSTGPHLHVALRDGDTNQYINPEKFFNGPDPVQVADIPDKIQPLSPESMLQQALESLVDTLADMSINFIQIFSQLEWVVQIISKIL
jgi:murein DD-endopeptidase MepM/ murein hydrolase activator NlpD